MPAQELILIVVDDGPATANTHAQR